MYRLLFIVFFISNLALATQAAPYPRKLECTFKVNGKVIPLEFTMGEDYAEEETELYYGKADGVEADVLFLPYQYGIVLTLYKGSESITDEGEYSASVSLDEETSLSCQRKKSDF